MTKEELEQENQALKQRVEELEERLHAASGGRAGWLVETPNRNFSGETAGVFFRHGTAFIPDGPDAERAARAMKDEFGYRVTGVSDWRELPQGERVGKSMIDVIMQPQVVG